MPNEYHGLNSKNCQTNHGARIFADQSKTGCSTNKKCCQSDALFCSEHIVNNYKGADYTSQNLMDFDWYNPHLYHVPQHL